MRAEISGANLKENPALINKQHYWDTLQNLPCQTQGTT